MEPGLLFVNTSHPGDIQRNRDLQAKIRRFATRNTGNVRSQNQSKNDKTQKKTKAKAVIKSLPRSLKPLGSFPVRGDDRVFELVRFCMLPE